MESDFVARMATINKKRHREGKPRKRGSNLSKEQRRAQLALNEHKRTLLYIDLKIEWARQNKVIKDLSEKHNIIGPEMRRRLQRLPKYGGERRKINRWNAVQHILSLEINEDVEVGEKKNLQELQQIAKLNNWKEIPEDKMDDMIAVLQGHRDTVKWGIRTQPSALMADVRSTMERVSEELKNLSARCGIAYALMMARTMSKDAIIPIFVMDETSQEFFEVVFNIAVDEMMVKYEAYHGLGIHGIAKNASQRMNMIRKRVRFLLTRGLRQITGENTIKLEWVKYREEIVLKHKVVLDGWPLAVFEVEGVGVKDLELVLTKIASKECKWRHLNPDEVVAHKHALAEMQANGQVRKRKQRSDVGTKRGAYKKNRNEDKENNTDASAAGRKSRRCGGMLTQGNSNIEWENENEEEDRSPRVFSKEYVPTDSDDDEE